jgi:hypothetical protein
LVEFFKYAPFEQKLLKKLYDQVLKNTVFKPYELNFEQEFQATKRQHDIQLIKNTLKKILPGFIKKKIIVNNDYFGTELIAKQMIADLQKNYNKMPVWGMNINSIQLQWFLERIKSL